MDINNFNMQGNDEVTDKYPTIHYACLFDDVTRMNKIIYLEIRDVILLTADGKICINEK